MSQNRLAEAADAFSAKLSVRYLANAPASERIFNTPRQSVSQSMYSRNARSNALRSAVLAG